MKKRISKKRIDEYIEQKKELYDLFRTFLDSVDFIDSDFQNLIKYIESHKINQEKKELEDFLRLLHNICNNYNGTKDFFDKFYRIFDYFKNDIKSKLSNSEIYDIFSKNKKILLFLIQEQIISINEQIMEDLILRKEKNCKPFFLFFLPEIKNNINSDDIEIIDKYLSNIDQEIFKDYEIKRSIGENESYLCSLIRNDSVEEFISYINQRNISLKSQIEPSIYESHSFLNKKKPTLIEYSAFFGSIEIFQYLLLNNVELEMSLWKYAIHGRSPSIIHLLEENQLHPSPSQYSGILKESIKCHHNEISEYLENNFIYEEKDKINNQKVKSIFKYNNYSYFTKDMKIEQSFFYLCKYEYYKIVNFYIKMKHKYIHKRIIKQ